MQTPPPNPPNKEGPFLPWLKTQGHPSPTSVSNSPFEPTEQGSSHEPTIPASSYDPNSYTVPASPSGPSGSQVPPYQQPSSYAPPPPPYEPSSSQVSPYQQSGSYTPPPPPYGPSGPQIPSPRKEWKKTSRLFVFLAVLALVVVVIGGVAWALTRTGPKTTSPPPVTTVVTKGEVSFLDSQDKAPGGTDALKITATGLPNLPDGSQYDAWLIDTANEQILPLGSLSKSDPNTFALSFPNASSQSHTNLIGAGNKIDVTREQGQATHPTGNVVLSVTFPPKAFVHIRHLLFKFPTTPGNIGLLPGLLNETQKVDALSQMLQSNSSNTASVACIAQAMINVIEGKNGTNYRPLADSCASVGIGDALIGDGFGILGKGYISTAAGHAALAASQSDTTDTIRQYAKDVETSTDSIKVVMTKIDEDALQLLTHPATTAQVSEIVSLSDHAYHGFDQNGDGKVGPVVGEAGALTAYTSGQHMATLALS